LNQKSSSIKKKVEEEQRADDELENEVKTNVKALNSVSLGVIHLDQTCASESAAKNNKNLFHS